LGCLGSIIVAAIFSARSECCEYAQVLLVFRLSNAQDPEWRFKPKSSRRERRNSVTLHYARYAYKRVSGTQTRLEAIRCPVFAVTNTFVYMGFNGRWHGPKYKPVPQLGVPSESHVSKPNDERLLGFLDPATSLL
jgi:hypothetical protein